jgi:predicted nucleic acid-binding protein
MAFGKRNTSFRLRGFAQCRFANRPSGEEAQRTSAKAVDWLPPTPEGQPVRDFVSATASVADARVERARYLLARGMRASSIVLLLQTLAEFSNVAWRKAGIPINKTRRTLDAWCAVLPIAETADLLMALEAVRVHRLAFWDAMLWASAQRAGVKHLLTEDFQDGFVLQGVTFVNPFNRENDQLIDEMILPRS